MEKFWITFVFVFVFVTVFSFAFVFPWPSVEYCKKTRCLRVLSSEYLVKDDPNFDPTSNYHICGEKHTIIRFVMFFRQTHQGLLSQTQLLRAQMRASCPLRSLAAQ